MGRRLKIGMVVDPVGSYGRGVIRGVSVFANESPHWSIVIEPKWSFETPLAARDWDVDGMIVQVYDRVFGQEVEGRMEGDGLKVVNVANWVGGLRLPTVVPDDEAIGRTAAEYFRSKGFVRFGYFGRLGLDFGRERMLAFSSVVESWGKVCEVCDNDGTDGADWVRGLVKPVAILVSNDERAHHLIATLKGEGIRVPEDVAVLGVDDDELINALVQPSLSSVPVPAIRVGYEAARLLDELLRGRDRGEASKGPGEVLRVNVPLTGGVVTRQSTDVLALEDEDVAAAVALIRAKGTGTLDVEGVLREVAVSRRSLERRFKAALGRGIGAEIRRVRMAKAKQLLAETELPIPVVAERSGFGGATRFGIMFRQVERMTPTKYRQFARGQDRGVGGTGGVGWVGNGRKG